MFINWFLCLFVLFIYSAGGVPFGAPRILYIQCMRKTACTETMAKLNKLKKIVRQAYTASIFEITEPLRSPRFHGQRINSLSGSPVVGVVRWRSGWGIEGGFPSLWVAWSALRQRDHKEDDAIEKRTHTAETRRTSARCTGLPQKSKPLPRIIIESYQNPPVRPNFSTYCTKSAQKYYLSVFN